MTDAPSIIAIWRAGRVTRWHSNLDLSGTLDYLDGHHARTTRLLLALWPDSSREALFAAMTHDDGEHVVGDQSRPLKQANPELARQIEDIRRREHDKLWGKPACINEIEIDRIELCDWLDAYLWARRHGAAGTLEWEADKAGILRLAQRLGVWSHVVGVMG